MLPGALQAGAVTWFYAVIQQERSAMLEELVDPAQQENQPLPSSRQLGGRHHPSDNISCA